MDDAETARSILACADEVELAVDGVPHPLDDATGVQDWAGVPTLVCRPGGALAGAAECQREAVLSVSSGLWAGETLLLAGRLRHAGSESCPCCEEERDYVVLDLAMVVVACGPERRKVDVGDFANPALQLNAGFLRRNEEHINHAHGDHLRHMVAQRTGVSPKAIVGAQVVGLSPTGVEVQWVTAEGAHRFLVQFPAAATTADDLGISLREALHPEMC